MSKLQEEIAQIVSNSAEEILRTVQQSIEEIAMGGEARQRALYEKRPVPKPIPQEVVGRDYKPSGKTPVKPSVKAASKPIKKPLGSEAMRCRYIAKNKQQCKERSGGPRFHFLCEKHRAPKRSAKK